MRGDLFASLLQFGDSLLARLVQIAEVGLQALPTLALFSAKNKLNAGVFALAESGVQLRGEITLLAGFCCSSLAIEAFISSICAFN